VVKMMVALGKNEMGYKFPVQYILDIPVSIMVITLPFGAS